MSLLKHELIILLSANLTQDQLLARIKRLLLEFDCDPGPYADAALEIPPSGFVQPELDF
jgi:hypothetical protein